MYLDRARQMQLRPPGPEGEKLTFLYYQQGVTPKPYKGLMKELADLYSHHGQYMEAVELLEKGVNASADSEPALFGALSDAYFA